MSASCPRCGLRLGGTRAGLCPRCLLAADEEEPVPTPPPGLVLEGELGRGGMGRVFRARHVRLNRPVALKLLPPELASDPSFEARFAREARALAMLAHPHIVAVHDFGTTPDGESYLVMEYAPGGTLRDRLPLAPAEALRIAAEVCDGLAYAHGKGLVHRDIKPENVLFDGEGRAKIADFGLARLAEPGPGDGGALTRPSVVVGTPGYMAPEARAGAAPDARMDVFAVGVLLYQMATGRMPEGTLDGAPGPLVTIVRRATAAAPAARFASATELRAAIEAAARALGTATAARPADALEALPPDEQSWVRAVALALAGATAVSLYAIVESLTPRVLAAGEASRFIMLGAEPLGDGRLATRARFETWPTLAAAGAWAVALATYGLLRRHWRHSGLEVVRPERRLTGTAAVWWLAGLIIALFLLRMALRPLGANALASYVPVVGGVLELIMVYQLWNAVLEALRTARPLRREPLLWLAVALSLVPPVTSFVRLLAGGEP